MMKPAPHHLGYLAAAAFIVAAMATVMVGQAALWQIVALFVTSVLFATVAIYTHRRSKRSAP